MNETQAAETFSALGSEKRLEVFRLLVRAGRSGLNVGEIQAHTAIAPSTLAHHIAALVKAGLVAQDKQGRAVTCTANYDALESVFAFMTDQCCAGVSTLDKTG